MSKPSVTILGAGIAGLSVAVELARRGCRDITLLERSYPAGASSGLAAGIYNRQYLDHHDLEIRMIGAGIVERLETEGRIRISHNGYLRVARDEALLPQFQQSVEFQGEMGGPEARVLSKEDLQKLLPEFNADGVVGGLFGPHDGYLDGHELCTTYLDEATERGVKLRLRETLVGHELRSNGTHVLITDKSEIETDVVVNAAGAWAGTVAQQLGFELEIFPQRHEAFVFQFEESLSRIVPSVMDYIVGSPEPGLYFRGEGHGQLLAGLHTNEIDAEDEWADPEEYFRGVIAERTDEICERLFEALPPLASMGFHSGWAGLYPLSADGQPIIGPIESVDGCFAACGLGGVGMQLGPASGRLVAEWILDGEPRSMPEATRWMASRFATDGSSGGAE